MARRRVEVVDVVEVLVQWQAGRSLKQIARSTGMSRNTVRRYLAAVTAVGLRREPVLPRSELHALVEKACPELVCRASTTDYAQQLREVREEIVEGLKESTMATVWQRLRDAGRVTCSVITFRRFVRREVREVDPDKVVVRRPLAALGDSAEIDFGVLGIWKDPVTKRRRRLWAFVMTLSASRHMFVRPVRQLDLKSWITCHVAAFEFFGAVPRRLVTDYVAVHIIDLVCPAQTTTRSIAPCAPSSTSRDRELMTARVFKRWSGSAREHLVMGRSQSAGPQMGEAGGLRPRADNRPRFPPTRRFWHGPSSTHRLPKPAYLMQPSQATDLA